MGPLDYAAASAYNPLCRTAGQVRHGAGARYAERFTDPLLRKAVARVRLAGHAR